MWATLLAFLVGGLVVGVRKPGEDAARPETIGEKEVGVANRHLGAGDPLSPLRDFTTTDVQAPIPWRKEYDQLLSQHDIEHLLVTVPDPVDSRFGFVFDQLMGVIQRAMEQNDYVFDRAWLPWELDKKKLKDKEALPVHLSLDLGGIFSRAPARDPAQQRNYRDNYPGMLLFRYVGRDLCKCKLYIVYLIGENPTSGIDKRVLTASLELIQGNRSQCAQRFRIVGPYFTGSQTALKAVLNAWRKHDEESSFQIISGSASAVDREQLLPDKKETKGTATFHATLIPSTQVLWATLHYLAKRDESRSDDRTFTAPAEPVAFLIEANTRFGHAVQKGLEQPESRFLILPFPLHIAGVEASFDKEQRQREEQQGMPRVDPLIPRLGKPPGPDADLIPPQDSATTAAVNGKVLTNILSIIAAKQLRYVGIVASDPRDVIFLASSLREHCPGIQIFISGAELLFSHPDFSYYLKGAIVGSTYPLLSANQRWTKTEEDRSRLVFASQSAQGYYNAILAQLGNSRDLIEYRPPLFEERAAEASELDRPPIWITMIGQNGDPVPLQYFTRYEHKDYLWAPPVQEARAAAGKHVELRSPGAAMLALLAVCLVTFVALGYAFDRPSPQPFWWEATPRKQRSPAFAWGMVYRTVCLGSLALLLWPIMSLCAIYYKQGEWSDWRTWWLPLPLTLLGTVGLALLFPFFREMRWFARSQRIWAGIALALLLLLSWTYMAYVRGSPNSWETLSFHRAVHFSSGVSLLLPLFFLCALFFFWAFFQMKGSADLHDFAVLTPYPPPGSSAELRIFAGVRARGQDLLEQWRSPWQFACQHRVRLMILACVLVVGVGRLWLLFLPIVEGAFWTGLFFCGFSCGAILVALDLVRFVALWSLLKNLFHEITLIRMMGAFNRLPAKVTSVFRGHFFPSRARRSQLEVLCHQLGLLQQETQHLLGEDARSLQGRSSGAAAGPDLIEVWRSTHLLQPVARELTALAESTASRVPGAPGRPPWNQFSKVSQSLLIRLAHFWPKRPVEEAFGAKVPADAPRQATATSAPPAAAAAPPPAAPLGRLARWVELAEGAVAIQVVIYISQFFVQLRNLAWSMIVCSVLLLLALTSYPFHPERLLLYTALALIGAVVAAILYVLVHANTDELVSRIAGTTPNRFTLDSGFISSVFTYIVPAVSIVAFQLSGTFRFLLEPILRILK
jgi:hypothetical protein